MVFDQYDWSVASWNMDTRLFSLAGSSAAMIEGNTSFKLRSGAFMILSIESMKWFWLLY